MFFIRFQLALTFFFNDAKYFLFTNSGRFVHFPLHWRFLYSEKKKKLYLTAVGELEKFRMSILIGFLIPRKNCQLVPALLPG